MDRERFAAVCSDVTSRPMEKNGIGTLSEKTMHAVLKQYFEPDPARREVKVGPYVADIVQEDGIVEIQTRSFDKLREKLAYFLELGRVTVVHPVAHRKQIGWIDTETGEVSPFRKSPKTGTPCDGFYELCRIIPLLAHPNLRLRILLVDVTETRYLNGWSRDKKRGSSRCDRIPTFLAGEVLIETRSDFLLLLPQELPAEFTQKELGQAARISPKCARCAIRVLESVGCIEYAGKRGRAYLYRKTQ